MSIIHKIRNSKDFGEVVFHVREWFKQGWKHYQKSFYHIGLAKSEALKPLVFFDYTISLLTFLAVWGNFRPSPSQIGISYLVVLVMALIIGRLLIKLGVVKYNNKIANEQNEEFMQILNKLDDISKKLINIKVSPFDFQLGISSHNLSLGHHNHCYNKDGTCYGAYGPEGGCKVRCHTDTDQNCWHFPEKK